MSDVSNMMSDFAEKIAINLLTLFVPSVVAGLVIGIVVWFIMKTIDKHLVHINNGAIFTVCKAIFLIVFIAVFCCMFVKVFAPAGK